jgi:hypothetical protein
MSHVRRLGERNAFRGVPINLPARVASLMAGFFSGGHGNYEFALFPANGESNGGIHCPIAQVCGELAFWRGQ